ncbi:hypothetical protein PACILC2_13940 [Paenibacillus cisolokensis]|uniref:DUF115 domain-containing protein n=1 Tax=Paenibacillus cisolokensis TaxID=1658519 RepID=A0ABQ4N3T2_9BACL|nr:hypothetical protein [Paenibacillus cisolokensis]GIQ62826.1 hypothetical protein PACILC2_13940 [Paenibacillus cisolokensis]
MTGIVIQLAAFLGFNRIIFVGQDFSYPGGVRYSKGVDHFTAEELDKFNQHATETVENVNGGVNPSSKPMVDTLRYIEGLISFYKNQIEFINVSQIGAVIKGTSSAKLENLMDELKSYHVSGQLFQNLLRNETTGYTEEEKKAFLSRYRYCLRELKSFGPKIDSLLETFEQLQKAIEKSNTAKMASLLQTIDKQWSMITNSGVFDPLYGFVLQAEISIYARRVPEIAACTNIKMKSELVMEHLGRLVAGMKKDTERLIDLFEETASNFTAIAT